MNKAQWKIISLLALSMLIANAIVFADENADARFHGGSYDGYADNYVFDAFLIPKGTIFMIH